MRLDAVMFDLDGTLGDTIPVCVEAFQRTLLRHTGRSYGADEIRGMFGPSEAGILQRHAGAEWRAALDTYLAEYERAHRACTAPFAGMLPLLRTLRQRGVRLGIVTGKGEASAAISVRAFGLDAFVEAIEPGAAAGPVKPAGIRALLARWNVAPEHAAYVGDAPYDVDAARQTGVVAVAAAWAPGADAGALAARAPDALFRSVPEFATWADAATRSAGA